MDPSSVRPVAGVYRLQWLCPSATPFIFARPPHPRVSCVVYGDTQGACGRNRAPTDIPHVKPFPQERVLRRGELEPSRNARVFGARGAGGLDWTNTGYKQVNQAKSSEEGIESDAQRRRIRRYLAFHGSSGCGLKCRSGREPFVGGTRISVIRTSGI